MALVISGGKAARAPARITNSKLVRRTSAAAAALAAFATPAAAAEFVVSDQASLAAAIAAANANPGTDVIRLAADISVSIVLPPITDDLRIEGFGHSITSTTFAPLQTSGSGVDLDLNRVRSTEAVLGTAVTIGGTNPSLALSTPDASITALSGGTGVRVNGSNGSVVNQGTISASGPGAPTAIIFANSSGDQSVINGSATNSAAILTGAVGIGVQTGNLSVDNYGSITASGNAINDSGTGSLTVVNRSTGVISSGFNAISVSTGPLVVRNSGLIESTGVNAVSLATGQADVVNSTGGTIRGQRFGIFTQGSVTLSNAGSIIGVTQSGMLFFGGTATNLQGGTISGATRGLDSSVNALTVVNSGTITGTQELGINSGAALTLTNNATGIVRGASGVFASSATVSNSGTIQGTNGIGVQVSGTLSLTNSGSVSSVTSNAIFASGANSQVTNSGSIIGSGVPAQYTPAVSLGGANSSVTNSLGGTITGLRGVSFRLSGAQLTNAGTITGTYDNAVSLFGGGTVTNEATGLLNGLGNGPDPWGIYATGGPVAVVNRGRIVGNSGIVVNQAGVSQTIDNSGNVIGTVNGVWAVSGTLGVSNSGLIQGGAFAILAEGGAATITSSGTIAGPVSLSSADDSLTNSGIFNNSAASTFGGGNDRLTNSGTINLGAGIDFAAGTDAFTNSGTLNVLFGRPAGTVTLAGLESLGNSGLIDLRNGRTGDILAMPGTFTGTAGSRLGLDVLFGTPGTSDRLTVGSAQGMTSVLVTPIGGIAGLGRGPILVQAAGASAADAFALVGGPLRSGFVQLQIVYDPATFSYALVGTPSEVGASTVRYSRATRELWYASADAWSAHMRELRDSRADARPGARLWFQGYGYNFDYNRTSQLSAFGATQQVDLSYGQDVYGGQAGIDIGAAGDGLSFGVTAGYADSRANFTASGDRLHLSAFNVGGYASFVGGPVFGHVLAKYDRLTGSGVRSLTSGFTSDLDGHSFGVTAEAGLRFGSRSIYLEPLASLSWVDSNLGQVAFQGTNVTFQDDASVRSRLGMRVGGVLPLAAGNTSATLYGAAYYVHALSGRDRVTLASGGTSLAIDGPQDRDYVEGLVGVSISGSGPISGFFEGRAAFADEHEGSGVRAGIRLRF